MYSCSDPPDRHTSSAGSGFAGHRPRSLCVPRHGDKRIVVGDAIAAVVANTTRSLSWLRSGTIRRIFPTRLSRRCGFCRIAGFADSPDLPSPQAIYRTRQSGVPGLALSLKIRPPMGCESLLSCTRISSRAVPSKVVFAVLVSVHSTTTASRCVGPGVWMAGVTA